MVSRHHSLDYSEVKDVTQLLQDFEEHNAIRVLVSFRVVYLKTGPSIVLSAEGFGSWQGDTVANSLGSVSVRCLDMNLKHWVAAITHLLYVLDAKLARDEMGGIEQNS